MRRGFRPLTLVTEVLRNLWANPLSSAVSLAIAIAVGFGVPTATLVEVTNIRADEDKEVRAGSNVLRVTGDERTPLPAARCEQINSVPGVLAAGGVVSRSTVFASARPGDLITLVSGTPSLGMVLWPGEGHGAVPPPATVVAGEAASKAFGLGIASIFAFSTRSDPRPVSASVDRVAGASSRERQLDASIFIAAAPVGNVDECLVEAMPGARSSVAHVAAGWFATSGEVVVSPLYLSTSKSATPEERLATRTTQYLPLVAAAALGVGMFTGWFSRRAELSLYRMLGLGQGETILMLATEMVAAVILPMSIGLVVAMAVMPQYGTLEIILATGDALRMVCLLVPIPLIGWVMMRPLTRTDALYGR